MIHRRISHLATAILAAFLLISAALTYWQVLAANEVLSRASNPRVIEEERRFVRGRILDRNGEVLASSTRDGDLAVRSYSYPPLAHVTGYASHRFGKSGLEEAMDQYLGGSQDTGAIEALRRRLLGNRESGADVALTLDLRLQRAADEALGTFAGAIVALDAHSGEVLALASHPYFDPNTIDDQWQALLEDPAGLLVHRPLQGQYVPGSVFKLVTAAAAIDRGLVTPESRHHHEGDLVVDGFRIRNTNHPHLTDLSFAEEFAWSCNPAFALVGLSLGLGSAIDLGVMGAPQPYTWPRQSTDSSSGILLDYARRFGIGERIPFLLPVSAGRVARDSLLSPTQLATTAFGQGDLQVSPLQLALVAATLANDGQSVTPYLVAEVRDRTGQILLRGSQPSPRPVVSASTARAVTSMMVLSVDTAYARPARIPGVRVAGKTGTAEAGGGASHSWFVGFAPSDRPGVVVAVIMEERGSGTQFATPAARKVLETALSLGY